MKKRIITGVTIFLAVVTIVIGIYNHQYNTSFWDVSVAQVLTLLVAIAVAFWATQFRNDQRSAKAHAEKVIAKIQQIVCSEEFYIFNPEDNEEERKKTYGLMQRKIANCLTVLKDYSTQFNFKDELKYLNTQFDEYRTFVSDKLSDFDYLKKSETHLKKLSQNIDSKCDQIVVKFYR